MTTTRRTASSAWQCACIRALAGSKVRMNSACATGEQCVCHGLDQSAFTSARQVDLPLDHDGVHLDCGYRTDIIVNNEVIPEVKSVEHVAALHETRLLIRGGSISSVGSVLIWMGEALASASSNQVSHPYDKRTCADGGYDKRHVRRCG